MSDKFYITTSIAYVNAAPHIGFAMELAQADVLARYHRFAGEETFFCTGTDEHGVKIYQTAKERGMETQAFVDENAGKFQALTEQMNLSNNVFIRTSSEMHKAAVAKFWMQMFEKGDIYKGKYEGLYCVGCESYIPEKDLIDGMCATHKKAPLKLSEENYFFKLSKYSDQIREAIASDRLKIVPEVRKNEILNIIGEGLQDVSFSRPQKALPWGVPVPNDPEQVMYVWCDALSNYLTALDVGSENYKKFWPADVHLIGKDILRFHAGVWIGMLLSLDLPLPKAVYVHGFITSEGQKMSKSLGNVVDPVEYLGKFGIDPLRYYLLREIPTTDDGDFSQERFMTLYNTELGNSIGNLVSRVFAMTEKYFALKVPEKAENFPEFEKAGTVAWSQYHEAVKQFNLKKALESLLDFAMYQNKFVDDTKPWQLAKTDMVKLGSVLYALLDGIRQIAVMLAPFLPDTAAKILAQYGVDIATVNFEKDGAVNILKTGDALTKEAVLFPKIV